MAEGVSPAGPVGVISTPTLEPLSEEDPIYPIDLSKELMPLSYTTTPVESGVARVLALEETSAKAGLNAVSAMADTVS
jgi:hypothetical protein